MQPVGKRVIKQFYWVLRGEMVWAASERNWYWRAQKYIPEDMRFVLLIKEALGK